MGMISKRVLVMWRFCQSPWISLPSSSLVRTKALKHRMSCWYPWPNSSLTGVPEESSQYLSLSMAWSVREVMPPTLVILAFLSASKSGESCFWPRMVPMMNWKSLSDAMLQVRCRVIHFGTSGFAVLTSESTASEKEIGILLCKNTVLQSVRNIIWYETNYDC